MKKIKKQKKKFTFPLWDAYFSWSEQKWLFVLVLAGTIIRIINAVYTPLWRDEVYIFFTARDNSLWKLITQQHWDTAHPPLHSILLHFWQMISIHPFWLRLPSIIASVCALYCIPILATKLVRSKIRTFPIIALFITSFSQVFISMQMVVRPYPFVILFVIISLIYFLELIESDQVKLPLIAQFCLVNFLAAQMDYSSFWLFLSYFTFFIIYASIYWKSIKKITTLFVPLFLSLLAVVPVLPYLFGNIENSLKLEQYLQKKFNFSSQGIRSGKKLYVVLSKKKQSVMFFDEKLNKVSQRHVDLSRFTQKVYIGLNLAPLSAIHVSEFRVCSINLLKNGLTSSIQSCDVDTKTNKLKEGYQKQVISRSVLRIFLANHSFFINLMPKSWIVPTLSEPINISKNDDVLLSFSGSEFSLITNPGVNIYNSAIENGDTSSSWNNIQRLTITPKNGYYTAYYHNQTLMGQLILEGGNIFEPFIGDIYFFSHSPEIGYATRYYLLCLFFLFLINGKSIVYVIKRQDYRFAFVLVLFWTPLVVSLTASVNGFPIFIAKNLFVVCIASLFMICLLVSEWRFIFSPFAIATFIGVALLLYIISLPHIGFVDPPYSVTSIVQVLQKGGGSNIAVISPNRHYFPLIQYELLKNNTKLRLYSGTIDTLQKQYERGRQLRNKATVYFLKFGLSKTYITHDFDTLRNLLQCDPILYKIPYIHLEKCF